jgi:mono/diheme cytochrome c family protein
LQGLPPGISRQKELSGKLMKKLAILIILFGVIIAGILWILSAPELRDLSTNGPLPAGDAANGKRIFWVGGCASCHAAPKAKNDARFVLGGGLELKTPFGIFRVPNISPDRKNGIGNWSNRDFAHAMLSGISPENAHYFPAFPYTSYARMTLPDVMDLWAFLKTLPPVSNKVADHDVPFPFNIRRAVGLWKWLYFRPEKVLALNNPTPQVVRGQYLVEGPGHCGECHTPRNMLGGFDYARWLAGGKAPEGKEFIPNITPHKTGIGTWSAEDIVYSLESGFKPDYDSFGSSMVDVQENMAELPAKDRMAIAAYLKAVPSVRKKSTGNKK